MTIFDAVEYCIFKKYADISGRASRGAFFSYFIFYVLFFLLWDLMILALIDYYGDINLLDFVFLYIPFALAPPLISVCCRRYHDCNRSAWLVLLLFVPIVNLLGLWLLCLPGTPGPNRFGPVPREVHFRQ